jgi:AcrR family transcriptional regulator
MGETAKENDKAKRLLEEGYKLFTEKGVKKTSIQNIVEKADVAKGTFYLYFKDKYELRDVLIAKKSQKLFNDALKKLDKTDIKDFTEQIIFIIDYVIDELTRNQILLKFISKDLGLGVFSKTVMNIYTQNTDYENGLYNLFMKGVKENNIKLDNPEVTLFMIVELVSSTCVTSILDKKPLPIKEYKPILFKEIRKMINCNEDDSSSNKTKK